MTKQWCIFLLSERKIVHWPTINYEILRIHSQSEIRLYATLKHINYNPNFAAANLQYILCHRSQNKTNQFSEVAFS